MKKSKKFLSMLLAVSMIMAMSVSAYAADEPATEISKFAGQTMTVGLYRLAEDGSTIREELHVDIPEGATVETQCKLVSEAAMAAVKPMALSANESYLGQDRIDGDTDLRLTQADLSAPSGAELGDTFTLSKNYEAIFVQFYDIVTQTGSPTKINVRVQNNDQSNSYNVYDTDTINWTKETAKVVMYEGETYGGGVCRLRSGDHISVWASTDTGSLTTSWVISAS